MELLQKYHQGIRSEIEARQAKFSDCSELGRTLLTRKHRDSAEVGAFGSFDPGSPSCYRGTDWNATFDWFGQIKEKLQQLSEKRKEMMFKWDDRWDWLRLREFTAQSERTDKLNAAVSRRD